MISVILLSMLMILISTLGVIKLLICGKILCFVEKSSFGMLGLSFSCILDFGTYIVSIAGPTKTRTLIRSKMFLSLEVALYVFESNITIVHESSCYVWSGASSCFLEMFKPWKRLCRTLGPTLPSFLEPLTHHRMEAKFFLLALLW